MFMQGLEYITKKKVKDEEVFYTVKWSPLTKVDKFEIIKKVPSVAGIYELFYENEKKNIIPFFLAWVWYGGLRISLRETTDPTLVKDEKRKEVLENKTCLYRYSILSSVEDMQDIFHYLALRRVPPSQVPEHSGRYLEIFVEEITTDKIVDLQ